MRRIILGVKLTVLVVWTVVCFGAYALLNLVGDELIRHADVLPVTPEGVEFTSWLLALLQKLGFGLVIGVWVLGMIVILLVGWAVRRLAESSRPMPSSPEPPTPRREHDPVWRLSEPET